MIKTDKYKKGVIAITQMAAELNPALGAYQSHYINRDARFVVQLTNGKLEIEIDLARECEEHPEKMQYGRLRKAAYSYKSDTTSYRHIANVDSAWKRLFAKQTKVSESPGVYDHYRSNNGAGY
jgi:hypothetical protein